MCGEVKAWPRANEGKVLLKTRALSKINLNGNLKPENQLLFKWIVLKIRVLVLENISQGYLCRSVLVLLPFSSHLLSLVTLLELTSLVLCSLERLWDRQLSDG